MVYSELGENYYTFGFGALRRPAILKIGSMEQRILLYYKIFQFLSCNWIIDGEQ